MTLVFGLRGRWRRIHGSVSSSGMKSSPTSTRQANRLFSGIVRSVNPHIRVEVGYMNQFVRLARTRRNDVLWGVISLSF